VIPVVLEKVADVVDALLRVAKFCGAVSPPPRKNPFHQTLK
jgi:hypothetical protein